MAKPEPTRTSSGDPFIDDLIARYNAETLTFDDAVVLYMQQTGLDQFTAGQALALAFGAEMDYQGITDQVGPVPPPGQAAPRPPAPPAPYPIPEDWKEPESLAPDAPPAPMQEIVDVPYDVAVWGDIEAPPLDKATLDKLNDEGEPAWYRRLRERADAARRADLAR